MNNLNESITQAAQLVGRAKDFEDRGQYESAIDYYKRALSCLSSVAKNKNNEHVRDTLLKKMTIYKQRAEELEEILKNQSQPVMITVKKNNQPFNNGNTNNNNNNGGGGGGGDSGQFTMMNKGNYSNDGAATEDLEHQNQFSKKRLKNLPNVTFDDIIGLEEVKTLLIDTITLPYEMPHLFIGNRKPAQSILLYGAPGNGKTELARALAATSNMNFYTISSSDIISKYVGESERNIKELFDEVKNNTPSILFIDELDSICSKRLDSSVDGGSKTKTLQEFLVQLDGICDVSLDGVLLLGATNLPWELDAAMLRRFSHRIYITMPTSDARRKMFEKYISKNEHNIDELGFSVLAQVTDNYSASDIANVCRTASMEPLKRIKSSQRFHLLKNGVYIICPCVKSAFCLDLTCIVTNYSSIQNKNLIMAEPITYLDVMDAITHNKSSIDLDKLREIEAWSKKK